MSSEETPPRDLSEGEIKLSNILKEKFPKHTEINVQDLSGKRKKMFVEFSL